MGKSFELLGLAAFNIFLVLTLSAAFLSGQDASQKSLRALTEANVTLFIEEVTAISSGQKQDMDAYSMTNYFMKHIEDGSLFTTTMSYDMPEMASQEGQLEMDKKTFIANLLQGRSRLDRHETKIKIDNIMIDSSGLSAKAVTTNYERGIMPIDTGAEVPVMMPVTGVSYCEQNIILGEDSIIKMAGASCMTDISFAETY